MHKTSLLINVAVIIALLPASVIPSNSSTTTASNLQKHLGMFSIFGNTPHFTGGLRLTGGLDNTYGFVEVSYNNVWGTICDDYLKYSRTAGAITAQVICDLLGYPPETTLAKWFSVSARNIPDDYDLTYSTADRNWLQHFYCRGSETRIDHCNYQFSMFHSSYCSNNPASNVGVICESDEVITTSTTLTTTRKPWFPTRSPATTRPTVSATPSNHPQSTQSGGTPPPNTCGQSQYSRSHHSGANRIVGGAVALRNQFPWIARLEIEATDGSYLCGGTIISKSYILTAAHCLHGIKIKRITAYLGDHDSEAADPGEKSVTVSKATEHAKYDSDTSDYDFALLLLSQNLTFSSWAIQPVCLPSSCDAACTNAGSLVTIAGWGRTSSHGSTSQFLRTANVKIGDWQACNKQYEGTLTDRMICAGYLQGGIDTCQGDSGGPLMTLENGQFKLCGVTSFGNDCALPNFFGVYSKVCSQLNWIKTTAGL